jgi:Ca-activated chloride channel family protein
LALALGLAYSQHTGSRVQQDIPAIQVHLMDWKVRSRRSAVEIWDGLGMSYMKSAIYLGILLLAAATHLSRAQSNYGIPAAVVPGVTASVPDTASATDQPDDTVLTIRKRVDEVNLLFIATDKHGKFVRDLNQADFTILDDHKPPQSIANFRRETDLPLELGLLVDTSGSVRGRFDFEQEAAVSFLQHIVRANFDEAFVMGFNGHNQVTQSFTDNVQLLATGVHNLKDGGGTALYDAVYRACRDNLIKQTSDHPVRRAIVIVSDGEDNQSEITRAQAIEMAQRAEVIIYAISTDDSGLVLRGDKVLQQLADATGGRAFFPFKMKDIKGSFAAIEDELRSQYVVSYHPADFDADGRFRSIEITSLKKDLQVRARKGYFAPRQ